MKKNKLGQFNKTVLISALLIEITTGAQAATIDVDGVTCTFNDAVTAANLDTATGGCTAGSGADVLELPADTTLTLTGVSDVNSDVTINGNGSTLDAAGADRVLRVGQSNYGGAGDLTINDTTISNGYSINNNGTDVANFGAGVRAYNGSTLIISNSTISNNNGGGVMFSASNGGVYNSVIKDNVSGNGFYGAGLSISASSVIVSNSTISANNDELASGGGGIYVTNYGGAANLQIMNSTISGNKTLNNGGGIHHVDYGNVTNISLTNVTLVNNTSTGDGGGL